MRQNKFEAAMAVLAAMGGESVAADPPTSPSEAKVPKPKVAKPAAPPKTKPPEAPQPPGPMTIPVAFPTNTTHRTADGQALEIVKVRLSYLVRIGGGRLQWFSAPKVQGMVGAHAAETEDRAEAAA
jgi:hypothetical protein